MAVKFNIVERKNILNKEAAPKFYASAKADGEVTLKSISKEIAGSSTTVSDTAVLAVLNEFTKIMQKHLADGKIVKFGDFGSFQVTLTIDGAETAEKFNSSLIKGNKIQFRPGADLRDTLKTLKYEKYSK